MFGLGLPEMAIITVVAVAIFGAKRIPELGKAVGQTLKSLREGMQAEPDKKSDRSEPSDF